MPNDNHSKYSWKSRLEEVSSLPGEVLEDKNATWEKLHSRLSQKPRRIQAVWYWVAAACLLTAIILPMALPYKNQADVVKTNTLKTLSKKATSIMPETNNEMVSISPSATQHRSITERAALIINKKRITKKDSWKEAVPVMINDNKITAEQPALLTRNNVDTIESIAAVPLKKKLKVVHINEIDPIQAQTNVAQNDHHSLRLKFINPETSTSFSLPSGRTGFTILKQKQASSN